MKRMALLAVGAAGEMAGLLLPFVRLFVDVMTDLLKESLVLLLALLISLGFVGFVINGLYSFTVGFWVDEMFSVLFVFF